MSWTVTLKNNSPTATFFNGLGYAFVFNITSTAAVPSVVTSIFNYDYTDANYSGPAQPYTNQSLFVYTDDYSAVPWNGYCIFYFDPTQQLDASWSNPANQASMTLDIVMNAATVHTFSMTIPSAWTTTQPTTATNLIDSNYTITYGGNGLINSSNVYPTGAQEEWIVTMSQTGTVFPPATLRPYTSIQLTTGDNLTHVFPLLGSMIKEETNPYNDYYVQYQLLVSVSAVPVTFDFVGGSYEFVVYDGITSNTLINLANVMSSATVAASTIAVDASSGVTLSLPTYNLIRTMNYDWIFDLSPGANTTSVTWDAATLSMTSTSLAGPVTIPTQQLLVMDGSEMVYKLQANTTLGDWNANSDLVFTIQFWNTTSNTYTPTRLLQTSATITPSSGFTIANTDVNTPAYTPLISLANFTIDGVIAPVSAEFIVGSRHTIGFDLLFTNSISFNVQPFTTLTSNTSTNPNATFQVTTNQINEPNLQFNNTVNVQVIEQAFDQANYTYAASLRIAFTVNQELGNWISNTDALILQLVDTTTNTVLYTYNELGTNILASTAIENIPMCVYEGTMIKMANGIEKPIELIQVGDKIMTKSWIGAKAEIMGNTSLVQPPLPITVTHVHKQLINKPIKAISIAKGTLSNDGTDASSCLIITKSHKIYLNDQVGYYQAGKLIANNKTLAGITQVTLQPNTYLYDLTLAKHVGYYANGLLVNSRRM